LRGNGSINQNICLLGRGLTETLGKVKRQFGMTYITLKERQTNDSLFEKTFELESEKYRSAKKRAFEQIL